MFYVGLGVTKYKTYNGSALNDDDYKNLKIIYNIF